MTTAHRDLAAPEHWTRSLERSRKRRELLPRARREASRKKHMSAALATAMVAGPGAPLAAAQVTGAGVSAAVAAESPANRAIEIREGGLPLQLGSQGELVAHVQKALHISADGVFGVQTDAAVRSYQRAEGLQVDGIVGLATWGSLFGSQTASGASIGGSHIPPQARERVEQAVQQAGRRLGAQGGNGLGLGSGAPGTSVGGTGTSGSTLGGSGTGNTMTSTPAPAPTGEACGSSTISSPVHGTVTSDFGPRDGRNHDGIDIAAPTGTPVRAAACGTVSLAGQQSGYGNIVCITHTSQFSTCYAHLSRFAVSSGTRVQQGQVIGYVGCTGSCTGPHLHFETRVGGQAQDPKPYLRGASIPGASTSQTSATSASRGGTTTATASQATLTQSGTSAAAGQDTLRSTTSGTTATTSTPAAGTATTTSAIGPTTDTAPPGTGDFAPAQESATAPAPAEAVVDTTAQTAPPPAQQAVDTTVGTEPAVTATVPAEPAADTTVTTTTAAAPAPAQPAADTTVSATTADAPAPAQPAATTTAAPATSSAAPAVPAQASTEAQPVAEGSADATSSAGVAATGSVDASGGGIEAPADAGAQ
jgi:murein DD-endopeptidase MepM/ murein hydrolase activator NlpD